jgi:hypothetical protein
VNTSCLKKKMLVGKSKSGLLERFEGLMKNEGIKEGQFFIIYIEVQRFMAYSIYIQPFNLPANLIKGTVSSKRSGGRHSEIYK